MVQILLCGGAVVTLSMGIRHGFGLWLQPITQEMGWTRESFALAIAIQNLSWAVLGIYEQLQGGRQRAGPALPAAPSPGAAPRLRMTLPAGLPTPQ